MLQLIHWFQTLKKCVDDKKPELDSLQERHRDLTYHDPSLRDPVLRSLQDDYDELISQIDGVITTKSDLDQPDAMTDLIDGLESMQREQAGGLESGLPVSPVTMVALHVLGIVWQSD